MPDTVILNSEVADGELRAYWQDSDLHVWGPSSPAKIVLDMISSKRLVPTGSGSDVFDVRKKGIIGDGPSFLQKLKDMGYDPATLVFSILKKDAPIPSADSSRSMESRLAEIDSLAEQVFNTLRETSDTKGVYVLDYDEFSEVKEQIIRMKRKLSEAMDQLENDKKPSE